MSADSLLQALTWALYLLLATVTIRAAVLRPRRFQIDTALFFAAAALIILDSALANVIGSPPAFLGLAVEVLLMVLPFLLLRLIDDFAALPRWAMAAALIGLALSVAIIVAIPAPLPGWAILLLVLYFAVLGFLATGVAVREARRSGGVTQRRLQAIAVGSFMLGATIVAAGLIQFLPALTSVWSGLSVLGGLLSGLAYFLGFAPPATLRRAWQEPELRAFLADAARLPQLEDTAAILRALEHGAAMALGVPTAAIGIWDEERQCLRFPNWNDGGFEMPSGEMLAGRAYARQQAIFSANAGRDDPANAAAYQAAKATAVLAAPITAGTQRLGVLVAYAAQPPLFAEDDLTLVHLLARQAAVILDYVRLYDVSKQRAQEMERLYEGATQAAREREQLVHEQTARAEAEAAVRARDEFLFVAAHELRTPITSLRSFVQILLRQAERRGEVQPARLEEALRTIERQTAKMTSLVTQLLDVSRLSTGKLLLDRHTTNVTGIVTAVVQAAQARTTVHTLVLDAPPQLLGSLDPIRYEQVVVSLIDNAIRYSPEGGAIDVALARAGDDRLHLTVRDHGIGIPPEKRAHIFDRFYQAHPGDYYGGLGLGLYIAREIVELHGGTISAEYPADGGVRFSVTVPVTEHDAATPPVVTISSTGTGNGGE
jgi:signal transduction histidine kinase